jgi:hypothetical protein
VKAGNLKVTRNAMTDRPTGDKERYLSLQIACLMINQRVKSRPLLASNSMYVIGDQLLTQDVQQRWSTGCTDNEDLQKMFLREESGIQTRSKSTNCMVTRWHALDEGEN